MKFVTKTRLFNTDQWFIEIMFLLMLPFLAGYKFAAKLVGEARKQGR